MRKRAEQDGKQFLEISSVTNLGIKDLVSAVAKRLDAEAEMLDAETDGHGDAETVSRI